MSCCTADCAVAHVCAHDVEYIGIGGHVAGDVGVDGFDAGHVESSFSPFANIFQRLA
jgi:hypothetical protein